MPVVVVLIAGVALSLCMALAWLARRKTGKSGWIDAIWSFATGGVGAALACFPPAGAPWPSARAALVGAMIGLWGLRLGAHIAARTLHGGDDPRYADLARQWGDAFAARLFWFLQIQALASLVLVLGALTAARNPAVFPGVFDFLGVAVFAVSLVGETISDRQLEHFRSNPANRGNVCDTGLWGLSRHPNYFFECLVWVSYALIGVGGSAAISWGWFAMLGPVMMYWLLAHVSGVPPLEAAMLRSRGAKFEAYQARVNIFFPGPPRRSAFDATGRNAP